MLLNGLFQEHDAGCGGQLASADGTYPFAGLSFEADLRDVNLKYICYPLPHRRFVWRNLGPFQLDHCIEIDDLPPVVSYRLHRNGEHLARVPSPILFRRVRENLTDVRQSRSAQERIGDRMQQYIRVGMANEVLALIDHASAEHEIATVRNAMGVETQADALVHLTPAGSKYAGSFPGFHLMLQPMLGRCSAGIDSPRNTKSSA